MPILFFCKCGKSLQAKDEFAGRRIRCPKCQEIVTIPGVELKAEEKQAEPNKSAPSLSTAPPWFDAFLGQQATPWRPGDEQRYQKGVIAPRDEPNWVVRWTVVGLLLVGVGVAGFLWLPDFFERVQVRAEALQSQRAESRPPKQVEEELGNIIAAPKKKEARPEHEQLALTNAKEIGAALLKYQKRTGRLPPPDMADGLSWRVALLPDLGHEELYKEFRFDQPWDGADNKKLIDRMPTVFEAVVEEKAPVGRTFFQLLVGADKPFQADMKKGPTPNQFNKATLLIVEGAKAVVWTKPDDIVWKPKEKAPKLGGQFPGQFLAVFGDGAARFLDAAMKDNALRALATGKPPP